jgi:hypothetical protein
MVGGPNPSQEDNRNCKKDCPPYTSNVAALSYVDFWNSYASNEVAINWNAPMVFLSGAAEALQNGIVKVSKRALQRTQPLLVSLKSAKTRIEFRIPSGWENGSAIISDLNGRVLCKTGFNKSGIASVSKMPAAQVVIVKVIAENKSAGKSSFTSKFMVR